MRKHRNKIIAGLIVAAVLTGAFFLGGFESTNDPGSGIQIPEQGNAAADASVSGEGASERGTTATDDPGSGIQVPEQGNTAADASVSGEGASERGTTATDDPGFGAQTPEQGGAAAESRGSGNQDTGSVGSVQVHTAAGNDTVTGDSFTQDSQPVAPVPGVPDGTGAQLQETPDKDSSPGGEGQPVDETGKELTVTLIISLASVLGNMDKLPEGKAGLIPDDGILLRETVVFYEGESVFNVLRRETRKHKIHLESTNMPFYNSAYIEGIGNIYEFDAGEGSGWIYSVNKHFPDFGCSRYILETGDVIQWLYTCDRGVDVGGASAADSYNWG